MKAFWRRFAGVALAAALLSGPAFASPGGALGAPALQARRSTLAAQLASNPFGGPVVLQSQESGRRVEGDVYAVLDHPFSRVTVALSDPSRWCDVLILHLNTKHCVRAQEDGATRIRVRVGKKEEQPVQSAALLDFAWKPPTVRADYMLVTMDADDGPYDTRDYELLVEAVPVEGDRTFLHMSYGFSFGGASSFAMKLYLATVGRDKVGFSAVGPAQPGVAQEYVKGMRGVTERNTMRYYLAIDAYLDSLAAPPGRQAEQRFAAWFDATERFPRQLHEVERDEYLRMKRNEYRRQVSQP